jgi:hypothetical protein
MALPGCGASFLLNTNVVAELTNISNAMTGETLDVTSFDSSCVREFIAGLRSGTIDVSGYYDPTDTNGQVALLAALLAGSLLVTPKFLVDGTNGFSAVNGVVSSSTVDAAVDGLVNFSATIQLSGTISVVSA